MKSVLSTISNYEFYMYVCIILYIFKSTGKIIVIKINFTVQMYTSDAASYENTKYLLRRIL